MLEQNIDVSVVVPAYNESKRLPRFLSSLISYCHNSSLRYEIIVVDDGSTDDTYQVALQYQSEYPYLYVLKLDNNQGKGYAVKRGLFKSKGKICLFMDADGSTAPDEIERNLHFFDEGCDILIGSRVIKSHQQTVKEKFYRKIIGKVFNFLVHVFLFKNIEDTQCGFKMFRKEIVRPLFSRIHIKGFGFDIELLFLAYKMGYKIKEVPVNWQAARGSKINLMMDSLGMLINILQVRNWHFTPINMQNKFMTVGELQYIYHLEKYHWWFQSKSALIVHIIQNLNEKYDVILDAGCGTGQNLLFLKRFGNCFGCDVVGAALTFCKKNELDNLAQCNLRNMCFKPQTFNLITSFDVIEHVEDPEMVLAEFRSILKDNGKIIVTVPAFKFLWSQHDDALCHLRRFDKKDLKKLFEEKGFKIEKIGYFFLIPFLIVAPIRLIRKIIVKKGEVKSDTTTLPPKFLNEILKWILQVEIRLSSIFPMPFGTTIYSVISKKVEKDDKEYQEISVLPKH